MSTASPPEEGTGMVTETVRLAPGARVNGPPLTLPTGRARCGSVSRLTGPKKPPVSGV